MMKTNFELLKNGNPDVLQQIYARYGKSIFWLGKKIIDDEFVVETLVQDTFLKLWNCRDRIRDPMHIYFFLRFVMKRECFSHYAKPRNKFFKTVRSLESYENYQSYLAGYDPADVIQNLKEQEINQNQFEEVIKVLPLLSAERKHLIELCLKYGFHYKAIAKVMGKGITETSNEIKRTIEDIKKIINKENKLENKIKIAAHTKTQVGITEKQSLILKMRYENKFSFAAIAGKLNLSQKQVHQEFMTAYKLAQYNMK
ncbi:RNA polymerase sigma factor [Myroides indicus]|uniref:RNA polymerase sigma factor (Sigma-70 family) n=1 Tax=Myroides indicus TaxID=1323422 RepID=A0A4R7F4M8_9FLAO|nr:sigma-70 family RNA polymerase sigma factor [Myroides indicus]TDS65007.1 RNA polymerase sigma factor (sigma-70 family) [Myroides indicus]